MLGVFFTRIDHVVSASIYYDCQDDPIGSGVRYGV
jgi:hypothetical protein